MDTYSIPAVDPCTDISCTASELFPVGRRALALRDRFGLLSPGDLAELIGVDERTLTVAPPQMRS